jgi:hypothetical protein
LAVLALAQNVTFKDKAGNLTVSGLASWRVTRLDAEAVRIVGRGSPFTAVWTAEGLTLSGLDIEGRLSQGTGGRLQLRQARVKGNVVMRLVQNTANQGQRTTALTGAALDYDAGRDETTIDGAVSVATKLERSGELFELRGTGATIQLYPLGETREWPARSGSLGGPVTMRLLRTRSATQRERSEGTTDPVTVEVTGRADRLAFDEDGRRIVLAGSVTIVGSDAAGFGEIKANRAVVRLNERREVVDIDFDGSPGVARIRDSKPKR